MTTRLAGLHHIVVAGGGAAGLELVTKLGLTLGKTGKARITLVDRSRTHLWKPLLHSVAAGSLRRSQHELNYLAQAYWRHFDYTYAEVVGLDRANRRLKLGAMHDEDGREITPDRDLPFDTLVMAIGSVTNDFGTVGAATHAIPLETPEQASRMNRRIVNACLRANSQREPVRPGQLHVAIIGAGATGTELAAELHRTVRAVVAYGMDRIDPAKDLHIVLIEAANRILPALPERISNSTYDVLNELGVEVRVGARVSEVRADGVVLADGGFIPSELVVWSAGIKAPDFLKDIDGLETNRINQLVVEPTPADHPRSRDLRHWRLLLLPATRGGDAGAAARPGRPSDGRPHGDADQSASGWPTVRALSLPGFRLAGFAGPIQHGRQPDGLRGRAGNVHRGALRTLRLSLALQDARGRPARRSDGDLAHPDGRAVARADTDRQAALGMVGWARSVRRGPRDGR
jgi:NADH dehydrogenase FAD-containing subunit